MVFPAKNRCSSSHSPSSLPLHSGRLRLRHGEMGGQSSKEKLKGARRRASLRAGELQAVPRVVYRVFFVNGGFHQF